MFTHRFGKRVPLPSSIQVRHELRLFSAQEDARHRCAGEIGLAETASWDAIIARRRELGIPDPDHPV